MRDPWARRPHTTAGMPPVVVTTALALLAALAVAVAWPQDEAPVRAAEAADGPTPAPSAPSTAASRPAPPAVPSGDPALDAALAGVTAWATNDPAARAVALKGTATAFFVLGMTGVDPADVPDCTPTAAVHGPPGVAAHARVQVTCADGTVLDVDLTPQLAGPWRVASILPAGD